VRPQSRGLSVYLKRSQCAYAGKRGGIVLLATGIVDATKMCMARVARKTAVTLQLRIRYALIISRRNQSRRSRCSSKASKLGR